jgi:NADH-quinone oxidoreductase subunit E
MAARSKKMVVTIDSKNKECVCSSVEALNSDEVQRILDKHRDDPAVLISILEEIQAEYGYLPAEAMRLISEKTGCSLVDIYGVATFYRSFSLKPRGKHLISVCMGTACHVRGGPAVAKEFERQLGIEAGETTADGEYTLETVNCLGACALGPIVVVDGHYFAHVTIARVKRILAKVRTGLDWVNVKRDKRVVPLDVSCPNCERSLMDGNHLIDGHPSISIMAKYNGAIGWLRLSSLYGSYSVESEYEVPRGVAVDLICPHCKKLLSGASQCPECGSEMAAMQVDNGGVVQACSHHGCKGHTLDLTRSTAHTAAKNGHN